VQVGSFFPVLLPGAAGITLFCTLLNGPFHQVLQGLLGFSLSVPRSWEVWSGFFVDLYLVSGFCPTMSALPS